MIFDIHLLLQILMNVRVTTTAVILKQHAPTQMEDTLVLATLDTLALDNNAQVQILLLSQDKVICTSLSQTIEVVDDRYKTEAHYLTSK